MQNGIVTFWNRDKGFGFIRPLDRGPDRFVHHSALIDANELSIGDRVEFGVEFDQKRGKEKAVDVKLI